MLRTSLVRGRGLLARGAAVLAATLMLAACGGSQEAEEAGPAIVIEEAWARPAPAGDNSAAYFVIRNRGADADTLVGAASDVAHMVEVHRSFMEDGIMKMEPVEELTIAPGDSASFEPGGYHVMFMGLERDLEPGTRFQLRLSFRKAGTVEVTVEVREP